MQGTPEQIRHFEEVVDSINNELDAMALKYDTRLLTTILLDRASRQLRSLCSAGIYSPEVIEQIIAITFEGVTEKLPPEQMPKTVVIPEIPSSLN